MSDEMQALLSAYAAGTLTDGEKKLLFEKAMADQALFDELMEAETMRAAMEGPLAKRALLHALEEEEEELEAVGETRLFKLEAAAAAPAAMRSAKVAPLVLERKSRRGMWVVLAACLVAGTFSAYWFFQKTPVVEVAQAPKSEAAPLAEPVSAPLVAEPKRVAPPVKQAPAEMPGSPVDQASAKQNLEGVARQEAPVGGVVGGYVAPAPAPAPSLTAPPESRTEVKKVAEEVATARPLPAAPQSASPQSASPQPSSPPQGDMVMALRDADKGAAKNESREKSVLGAARAVGGSVVPVARVLGRRLEIRGDLVGQLYVFLSEGARFRRVPGLAPIPLLNGGAKSFGVPEGIRGTLFVLVAPQRDAELDGLADPHEGSLPVRNWTRISFQ